MIIIDFNDEVDCFSIVLFKTTRLTSELVVPLGSHFCLFL